MRLISLILIVLFTFNTWAFVDLSRSVQQSVTPSDTATDVFKVPASTGNHTRETKALYIGTGGTLIVVKENGDEITFTNVPDASILPINCVRVKSTGTTASGIVAYF